MMPWRRKRRTVRQGLTVVAVIEVALGLIRLQERRTRRLARAGHHRVFIGFRWGNHVPQPVGIRGSRRGVRGPAVPPHPIDYSRFQRLRDSDSHIDWHWSLAEQFERAAHRPWIRVPAEPECPGYDHFYRINVARGLIANP